MGQNPEAGQPDPVVPGGRPPFVLLKRHGTHHFVSRRNRCTTRMTGFRNIRSSRERVF